MIHPIYDVRCPKCEASHDLTELIGDGDEPAEIRCGECGHEFNVHLRAEVSPE